MLDTVELKDNVTENSELVKSSKKKKKRRSEKVEQNESLNQLSDLKLNESNNLEVKGKATEDVIASESNNVGSVKKDKKKKKKRKHEKDEVQEDSQTEKKKKQSVTVEYSIDDESNVDDNIVKENSKSDEQNENAMETESNINNEGAKKEEETVDENASKPKEKKDKAERKKKKEKKIKEKETKTEVEEEYKGLNKQRIKHLKHEKNSHQVAMDKKTKLAVEYLTLWKEDKSNWKFKSLRESFLIYNSCNPVLLPDDYFDLTLDYLCSIKGVLRNKVVEVAKKVKEGDVSLERAKLILEKFTE